jgi:ATP-dependent Clp protease protease subunit
MSVYDTMHYVTCDVATYCIGMAASMAATLLAAGTKGKRNALPHAEVMIHQVLGGARGAATDIEIRTKHLLRTKKTMNEILHKLTGQPLERVERDTDRDNFMSAQEAKEYGLVDNVLERLPAGPSPVKPASE